MIKLDDSFFKRALDELQSVENKRLLDDDIDRSMIYNGQIKEVVTEAIRTEFKKPETIRELQHRLIPINIVQKVVNKLGQVYIEPPVRKPSDRNEDDLELVGIYEDKMNLNTKMKTANRHFKLYKRALVEIYLDKFGRPNVRPIDRPAFHVFSDSAVSPEIPEAVLKIVQWDEIEPRNSILEWWTESEFKITDGKGNPINAVMAGLENDGVNPFGTLPFVYINESITQLCPLPDDDLLKNGIAIPLLLSDLSFATKYQSWGLIYTVGVDGEIPFNPNSVINLDFGEDGQTPSINTVKPDVDIDKMLTFIETLVAMLLSTKNLSAGTVQGKLAASNVASGISKMLDNAETLEDRKEQTQYFIDAEKQIWYKLAHHMIPYWRSKNLIKDDEMNDEFSDAFELAIHFPEPKVIQTDQEKMSQAKFRIDNGFSTLKRELQKLNPSMSELEIDALVDEIREEKQSKLKELADEFGNQNDDE